MLGCSLEGELFWWSDILQGPGITFRGSVDIGGSVVFAVNLVWDSHQMDKCLVTSSHASMWIVNIGEVRSLTLLGCVLVGNVVGVACGGCGIDNTIGMCPVS